MLESLKAELVTVVSHKQIKSSLYPHHISQNDFKTTSVKMSINLGHANSCLKFLMDPYGLRIKPKLLNRS